MNWKEAISELIQLGYFVSISGRDLYLKWQGKGDPPKERFFYLLQILKNNKEEILRNPYFMLLGVPIRDLKKPLAVHSQILDEIIYLVANEEMARQVEAEGKIAYIPEEIVVLSRASKTRDREEWVDFLKKMHLVKKTFMGSRIQV